VGRVYQDELGELSGVPGRLPAASLRQLREAIEAGSDDGIVVVASGGARVVAEWFCQLHLGRFGRAATSITPLQYASIQEPLEAVTWFVSAGGSHADIMHASRAAIAAGSRRLAALIGRADSPLSRFLWQHGHTHLISLDHPAGMDGFLATNSLWSMILAVGYAYGVEGLDTQESMVDRSRSIVAWAATTARSSILKRADASIVVLHDGWTGLGALDFEIRCTEASLHHLWRSDFRNFGHGRHYWLADRGSDTEVIALGTERGAELAAATLAEIPSSVMRQKIIVPYEGALGSVASLSWSMYQTAVSGLAKGRDPGRPGVPRFGEQLYEGKYPWPVIKFPSASFDLALERKIGRSKSAVLGASEREQWRSAYRRFVQRLSTTVIRGVVFDFDGTLVDTDRRFDPIEPAVTRLLCDLLKADLPVGIATGRGDSACRSLRDAIPAELRERVIVGYHNGAEVRTLSASVDDLDDIPISPQISAAAAILEPTMAGHGLARVRARASQCTVTPCGGMALDQLWSHCSELIYSAFPKGELRVVVSSHSIDITLSSATKLRVVEALVNSAKCVADAILRVGDKGAWPGNDSELLHAPLGISVDFCALDPDSCWNVAPAATFGPRATVDLFKNMEVAEKGIRVPIGSHHEA
jgi:hypothetical protein